MPSFYTVILFILYGELKLKRKDFEEIYYAFDLGFSDGYKAESVRYYTLKNELEKLKVVKSIIHADSIVNFHLFNKLGSKHPSSELWLETNTDLHASIYLVLGGYYRQGLMCLRSWFEITLDGIYYSRNFRYKGSKYEQWKKGERRSPSWKGLLESLFSRDEFVTADKIDLTNKMQNLHDELCAFVHNTAMDVYDLQKGRDNVPRYISSSSDLWFNLLKKTFNLITLVQFVAYSKQFKEMRMKEYKEIEPLLSEETKKYISFV